jgi:aspartyl-tRNA(Asn)/glutamyl-tRNA(Gln) amidotransferase subunit C
MSLSDDQLRRLARLARIALHAEEASAAAERLNRVLALIDEMRRVDTANIEPMAHPQDPHSILGQPLRVDSVTETDQRERYQAVAPAVEEGLYLVPKVLE